MKSSLMVIGLVALCQSTFGGVFDDAVAWYRGVEDKNDDGTLQSGEFCDVRHPVDSAHFLNQTVPVGFTTGLTMAEEKVASPFTNIKTMRTNLKFVPEYRVRASDGMPQVRVSSLQLPPFFTVTNTACFSLKTRFRIDEALCASTNKYCDTYILNCDCIETKNADGGLRLGYRADPSYGATNFHLTVLFGNSRVDIVNADWKSSDDYRFTSNQWIDVSLVLNNGSYTVYQQAEGGKLLVYTGTISSTHAHLNPTCTWWIGSRAYTGANNSWQNAIYNGSFTSYAFGFKGSLQELAIWSRTLSENEVFEAFGWPSSEVFKLGVANGASDEFGSGTITDEIEIDPNDDLTAWKSFRGVLSTEHVSVAFKYDCPRQLVGMNQALRFRLASDSAQGSVQVLFNGRVVNAPFVRPSEIAYAYIHGRWVTEGTNTVMIRVLNPTGVIKIDSIRFGGSWQVGFDDSNRGEMGDENTTSADYQQADADWKKCRRAVKTSRWHSVIHAHMPDDLVGQCAYRYVVKVENNDTNESHLQLYVNDVLKANVRKTQKVWEIIGAEIASDELATGQNLFRLTRAEDSTGSWNGVDYYRLELLPPPPGFVVILK